MIRRTLTLALFVALCLALFGASAAWAEGGEPVSYIDADGSTKTATATPMMGDETVLPGGWYVARGTLSYDQTIRFTGDAHLILADGASMTVNGGTYSALYAADRHSLTLYGQVGQNGRLIAVSDNNHAIAAEGAVTINGGDIEATSGGTGNFAIMSSTSGLTVNGGSVTAHGGQGKGIYAAQDLAVHGGTVRADGRRGIESFDGVITIDGGVVIADGAAYGIYANYKDIILGLTAPGDSVTASKYYVDTGSGKTVTVRDDQTLLDPSTGAAYTGDITAKLADISGATLVPLHTVSLAGNIKHGTVTADRTAVAGNAVGDDRTVTLIVMPDEGYMLDTLSVVYRDSEGEDHPINPVQDGTDETRYTFTMPGGNVTVTATISREPVQISYIDADGSTKIATAIPLMGDETELPGRWYVAWGTLIYDQTILFTGNTHLILADGGSMTVTEGDYPALYVPDQHSLTLYGQKSQTGRLTAVSSYNNAIEAEGAVTINGGDIEAMSSSRNKVAIEAAMSGLTVNGGRVTAHGGQGTGIYAAQDLAVHGGTVSADGANGIRSLSGNITLGWTDPGGSITASSYIVGSDQTVTVRDGQALLDPSTGAVFAGNITAKLTDIAGATLVPAHAVSIAEGIEHGTVTATPTAVAASAEDDARTVTLTVTPDSGYRLDTLTVKYYSDDVETTPGENNTFTFTMPDGRVNVTAAFKLVYGTPDFTLPAALQRIEANAFEGAKMAVVYVPDPYTEIGAEAFKSCTALTQIRLPQDCAIHDSAFTGCGTVYVFAPAGGTTEAWCHNRTGVVFVEE